jgi:hypothetical protein
MQKKAFDVNRNYRTVVCQVSTSAGQATEKEFQFGRPALKKGKHSTVWNLASAVRGRFTKYFCGFDEQSQR